MRAAQSFLILLGLTSFTPVGAADCSRLDDALPVEALARLQSCIQDLQTNQTVLQGQVAELTRQIEAYLGRRFLFIPPGRQGRRWSDGQLAKACWDYRHPTEPYVYHGDTGDGRYTIDPDGSGGTAPFDVYCDMSTDGGGWTLVDNDANASDKFTSRSRGANPDVRVTKGSYLPAYAWSVDPQLLCKSDHYTGHSGWLTLRAAGPYAFEYPIKTTATLAHGAAWQVAKLNGNTNQGVTSWIYKGNNRFGSVWIGSGSEPTCACNYVAQHSGLGHLERGNVATTTCSTWVR